MKNYLLTISLSFLAILAPIQPLILLAFSTIILDTYFGIWKTIRIKGWSGVRSRRMSDTITKTLLYVGGIVCIFFAEKYILVGLIDNATKIDNLLTKAFTLFCVMTEGKSISESYKEVTGKNIWKAFFIFVQRQREERTKQ